MRPRRPEESPVGMGDPDIPYDRSGMAEGISGIPAAVGGMKKMSLEFAEPQAEVPQIPQGAGVPPAGMEQGGIPPAGMQAPQQGMPGMEQGQQNPMLAGMMPPQQQGPDSSMFTDADLAAMMGGDQGFDPIEAQGQEMFDASMQDPAIQQQLLLAARRGLGGM